MIKKLSLLVLFFILSAGNCFADKPKILVGSPIRQKSAILTEFLNSFKRLDQINYELHYLFVDDNIDPDSSSKLDSFAKEMGDKCTIEKANISSSSYLCNEVTHFWRDDIIWKVAAFKDRIIEKARNLGYDYLFLIDSDIVLHPKTIDQLIVDNKEIVSNIFWTAWQPNSPSLPQVWLFDHYTLFEIRPGEEITKEEAYRRQQAFLDQLKKPGVYEVGGLGACTLISRSALKKEISFRKIKNLTFWGEDRHFCVRASALGISLFVDTHHPAYHIYRQEELAGVDNYVRNCICQQTKHRITLSMIMKNEANRYLRQMLTAAKEYITDAVIIDDASTDNSVEICREILKDIPLHLIQNKISKFSNEITLRKQQWEETIRTNPEWILNLDADEIFEDRFKDEIQKLVAAPDVDAYHFRLYDLWDETHFRADQYWSAHLAYRPFLFRYKPGVKYEWRETAQHCGRIPLTVHLFPAKRSELRLKHYGWAKKEDRMQKYMRYKQLDPDAKYGWKEQYDSILDENPRLVSWVE